MNEEMAISAPETSKTLEVSANPEKEVEVRELIRKPRFLFGLISQMLLASSLQYIAPTLSIHLSSYGYTPQQIAVSYGIPAILYATSCPFMYLLTQRVEKRGIILIGFVLITLAMAMIGGSDQLFQFQKQPVFVFIGLCVMGVSAGMVSIPVLPEMLDSIGEDEELGKKYDKEMLENYISGLFVSFQSLGEAIGPMVSSYLADTYNFQTSQESFSFLLFIFFISYFFSCGNFKMFSRPKSQIDEEDMEQKSNLITAQEPEEQDLRKEGPKNKSLAKIEEEISQKQGSSDNNSHKRVSKASI